MDDTSTLLRAQKCLDLRVAVQFVIRSFWLPLTMNWCLPPEKGPEYPSAFNLRISSFLETAVTILCCNDLFYSNGSPINLGYLISVPDLENKPLFQDLH